MTDQDQDKQRQHWQAVAEQLGLADQPPSSPEQRRTAQESQASVHQQTAVGKQESEIRPAVAEETDPTPEETPLMEEPQSDAFAEDLGKLPEEETEARGQRERRGRRGGRRSARSRAEDMEATEGSSETSDEGGKRRKSTRVRKKDASDESPDAGPGKAAEPSDADEDEGDFEDFSNWSVPSWNELIASLYRPSR
jgi:hypothetical protein